MTETSVYGADLVKIICSKCKHVIPDASPETVLIRLCKDGVHRWFCEACAE